MRDEEFRALVRSAESGDAVAFAALKELAKRWPADDLTWEAAEEAFRIEREAEDEASRIRQEEGDRQARAMIARHDAMLVPMVLAIFLVAWASGGPKYLLLAVASFAVGRGLGEAFKRYVEKKVGQASRRPA